MSGALIRAVGRTAVGGGGPPAWTGPPGVQEIGTFNDRGGGAGALDIAWPTVAVEDIAFLHVISFDAGGTGHTISTPGGWSLAGEAQLATLNFLRHGLFWKRCVGTESGTQAVVRSDTATPASTNLFAGRIATVRGAVATGTPYEDPTPNTAQSVNMAGAAIDTTGVDRLVLHFCGVHNDVLSAEGGGFAEEYEDLSTAGTDDGAVKLYSLEQLTAATVGPVTHTLAASTRWHTNALAMIPR